MYKEIIKLLPEEVLVYLRKSRSDDPSLTIEEVLAKHQTIVLDWIGKNLDAPVPESNWYREIVSGETISSRPKFKELLKRIESPKIKAVLVVECQRLGRPDLEEIGKISKLFRYTNTLIITPHKTFDLRDEWDREQFERELMRGNDYLEYSKKIMQRGKEVSLRSGYFVNAVVPYGYEREWICEGNRKRPSLSIVESEQKVVQMIFDWYANEGIGTTKISQRLNALGIPARKGGLWKKSTISNILKNEHYIGKVVIKKHVKVKTVLNQEITSHCVFNEEFEMVDGKHPALIDEELFYKANNKIHRYPSVKPSVTLQNPYASILKCECGRVMFRRKNRNTFRYLCDEQTFCGNASVSEHDLTEAIIKALKQNLDNLSVQVTDDDVSEKEKHMEYIALLKSKYADTEKKEISLWDKYAEEQMPKQIFDTLMAKCMEDKKNIENSLEQAYNDAPEQVDYKNVIATLHDAIDALRDDTVSASVKNKLLMAVVDRIVYRRQKAERVSPEEAKEKGLEMSGGWYCPPFELDIYLKI